MKKIFRNIILTFAIFTIVMSFSGCGKVQYIEDVENDIEQEEILTEYYGYKDSVMKQLESKIDKLDKMKEVDFGVLNTEDHSWYMSLLMSAKEFGLHFDRTIYIEATTTTITLNTYDDVMNKLSTEELIADDVYSNFINNTKIILSKDSEQSAGYFSYSIYGIEHPTKEDYMNKDNHFQLYVNLDSAWIRNQVTCSDEYFEEIKSSIDKLLTTDYFKDIQNVNVIVFVAGCGEGRYNVTSGNRNWRIVRTVSGEQKAKDFIDKDKSELEKMSPEEREKFIEEHQDDIDAAIKYTEEHSAFQETF